MVGHAAVIETAVANASAPIVKSSGSTFKFVLIVVGVIAIVGVMGLGSLVYVGYRVKKKADEYIQTSSTSARDTCAECTNHGYRNVKQLHSTPVPPLRPGDSHTFRAEMNGDQVRVFVAKLAAGLVLPNRSKK